MIRCCFTSLLVILLLAGAALAGPREQPPSNLRVLEQAVLPSIMAVLDSLAPPAETIMVTYHPGDELAAWMARRLQAHLLDRHWTVYDTAAGRPDPALIVRLEKAPVEIEYRVARRNLLGRASRYTRNIRGEVEYQILSSDGQVLRVKIHPISYRDDIPRSALGKIENNDYPFSRGIRRESGLYKWILEPAIVTVSTFTVVYLFYVLRSGS